LSQKYYKAVGKDGSAGGTFTCHERDLCKVQWAFEQQGLEVVEIKFNEYAELSGQMDTVIKAKITEGGIA
jgi:hypothetical protein